jgi:hypothetical protein
MECRHPHAAAVRARQKRLDARAHFFRRLVRERDGEHIVGLRVTVPDEIGDAARDDAGLPGAGPGQNEERSVDVENGFALFRIEGL